MLMVENLGRDRVRKISLERAFEARFDVFTVAYRVCM
jgi:hypothetical protein